LGERIGTVELNPFAKAFVHPNLQTVIGARERIVQVESAGTVDAWQKGDSLVRIAGGRPRLSVDIVAGNVRRRVEWTKGKEMPRRLADVSCRNGVITGEFALQDEFPLLHVRGREIVLERSP